MLHLENCSKSNNSIVNFEKVSDFAMINMNTLMFVLVFDLLWKQLSAVSFAGPSWQFSYSGWDYLMLGSL